MDALYFFFLVILIQSFIGLLIPIIFFMKKIIKKISGHNIEKAKDVSEFFVNNDEEKEKLTKLLQKEYIESFEYCRFKFYRMLKEIEKESKCKNTSLLD
jgi:hypothetical protein